MRVPQLARGNGLARHRRRPADAHLHVEGFEVSPFEGEFGRHIAIFCPAQEMAALKERLLTAGAHLMQPLRATAATCSR
jgi:hypothetical protein